MLFRGIQNSLKLSSSKPTKKIMLIKNEGITFLLRKIYIIVPDYLRYLINKKNYLYLYFPINITNFSINKNILSMNKEIKYHLCLNKEQLIEEVKYFLGYKNNFTNFKFDLYNEKFNLIKSDEQLIKNIKNINNFDNNILYIKINKENINNIKKSKLKNKYNHYLLNKKINLILNEDKEKGKGIRIENEESYNINTEKICLNKQNEDYLCYSTNKNKKLILNDSDISNITNIKTENKNTSTDDLLYNTTYNKRRNNINDIYDTNNKCFEHINVPLNSNLNMLFYVPKRNLNNNLLYSKNNKFKRKDKIYNKRTFLYSAEYYKNLQNKKNKMGDYTYFTDLGNLNKINNIKIIFRNNKNRLKGFSKRNKLFNKSFFNNDIFINNKNKINNRNKLISSSFDNNHLTNISKRKDKKKGLTFSFNNISEEYINLNKLYLRSENIKEINLKNNIFSKKAIGKNRSNPLCLRKTILDSFLNFSIGKKQIYPK